jgi:signal peptidase I
MRVLSTVFLLLLGGALLFGFLAPGAAPLTVTSPVSDSMEPTAPQHSLVVVVNGGVDVGEIILFESPQRDRAVLHRAVGTAEATTGYVTQGDANELPDQAVGMTPVSESQINGVVPTVAGHPVVLPYVGGILTNPVVLLGSWGLLALSVLYTTQVGTLTRGTVTTVPIRRYGTVFALLVIVSLPVATALFAVPVQTEIATSATASPTSSSIAALGGVSERTVSVSSPFFAVLHTAVTVDGGLTLQDTDSSMGEQTTYVTVQNPPVAEPTTHEGTVQIYVYPEILPGAVMTPIEAVHPVLASFVSSLVIGGLIFGACYAFDKHRILRGRPDELRTHRNNRTRWEKK